MVAAVANRQKLPGARTFEARRFMQFLRSPDTQRWIQTYGEGKVDRQPLFFPVSLASPASDSKETPTLRITGEVAKPLNLDAHALAELPRQTVRVKDRSGADGSYQGVLLRDLLKLAGAPMGNHQMRGPSLSLYAVVESPDGYRAVFTLAELDDDLAERSIILANARDGHALEAGEGPLRLISPQEMRPARWVKNVVSVWVERAP
jgi:DMSO/TMAO reductase YedYZ molybdopterin-dependent catalytic subunit